MEASTVADSTKNGKPDEGYDGKAEATRTTSELFQWSTFVHVGDGAEECEHRLDGECQAEEHFHCWLCLPNLFQQRDLNDKARAAKARKRRTLMQSGADGAPASDAYLVLEEQLEGWALSDRAYETLVRLIAERNVLQQYREIMDELAELEQFENRGQDVEEYQRLLDVEEDERDGEAFDRLRADMEDYAHEFEERRKARVERELEALTNTPREDVIDIERQFQIGEISSEVYLHIYYTWAYFTCARVPTLKGHANKRIFKSPDDLRDAPPEVLIALKDAYRSLETRMTAGRGDAAGN